MQPAWQRAAFVAVGAVVAALALGCGSQADRQAGSPAPVSFDVREVPLPALDAAGKAVRVEKAGGKERVIAGGKPGPVFDRIADGPYPVGEKAAYVGYREGKYFHVLGDVETGPFEAGAGDNHCLNLSPDGRHVAYLARRGTQQCVIRDGVEGKSYDARPGLPALEFSPDSNRLAYVARKGGREVLVVDGQESPAYDSLAWPFFSGDSMHWSCEAGRKVEGRWEYCVLTDGVEGKWYGGIVVQPVSSPDLRRTAYMAARAAYRIQYVVVVDGVESAGFDPLKDPRLTFSPDSKRIAYEARRRGRNVAVFDEIESREYERVWYPRFSPDSKRTMFEGYRSGKWRVVVDGVEGPPYDLMCLGFAAFSPDSRRTAYAACTGKRWFMVVDGREGRLYEQCWKAVFSPDSRHVAYTARRDSKEFLVVDGAEIGPYEFDSRGEIVFDSPTSLHVTIKREDKPVRLEVRLPPFEPDAGTAGLKG